MKALHVPSNGLRIHNAYFYNAYPRVSRCLPKAATFCVRIHLRWSRQSRGSLLFIHWNNIIAYWLKRGLRLSYIRYLYKEKRMLLAPLQPASWPESNRELSQTSAPRHQALPPAAHKKQFSIIGNSSCLLSPFTFLQPASVATNWGRGGAQGGRSTVCLHQPQPLTELSLCTATYHKAKLFLSY